MNLKPEWSRIALAVLIGAAVSAVLSVLQPQLKAGSISDLVCELLLLPGKLFASVFQDRGDASPEFLWRSRSATGVVLAGVAWCCLTLRHRRTSVPMQAYIEIMTAALPEKRTIAHSHEWYESDGTEKCRKCGAVNKGIHTLPYTCWDEHQVVPNDHLAVRYELTDSDLREIGEFTRENVLTWMESHKGVDWFDTLTWGPIHDFHAVCGDIDIPWGAEEGRSFWTTVADKATLRYTTKWRS